ncbi:F-box protein: endocytic membrane traffic, recycling ReCYcling 1 [Coemansia sp. RSA 552]|nr:F-box protein: endocytic membrane traffic, recycling ReCYcling 1 [Coemansia sp. RSA 552]
MSDSEEESGSWLGMAVPRSLLDRTAKFVLSAAQGNSRSLLPTTDEGPGVVAETAVVDMEDEEYDKEEEEEDDKEEGLSLELRPRLVPEREVLAGRWAGYEVSAAEAGLVRVSGLPARRRTGIFHERASVERGRMRAACFSLLPVQVLGRIQEFLPVREMLAVSSSCRVVRRATHRGWDAGAVGDAAYTVVGMRVWRALLRRMGWRPWMERRRGRERRRRVAVPASHGRLVSELSGVRGEAELVEVLEAEPDLLFKALFANLHADCLRAGRVELGAERLDQLLWFARGAFVADAARVTRRLVAAADRLEARHAGAFRRALARTDVGAMRASALALEPLRGGRACMRILVDVHPLLAQSSDVRCVRVRGLAAAVRDAHSFGVFLDAVQELISEHARVVELVLPPPELPASALYAFVQALFAADGRGLLLQTLERLYAHLRAIPVGGAGGVPDEATKDIVYLSTVASVVELLLEAAGAWARLGAAGGVPLVLGRRCVFSAFDSVIADYVQLEGRVIERAYRGELAQWVDKRRAEDDSLAGRQESVGAELSAHLVNFQQRQQQMDSYKAQVLRVLEDKLGVSLPPEMTGEGRRRSSGASDHGQLRRTVVGDVLRHAPVSIDMCLNMVLTNRDTVRRLAVFAEAPPDMRLRERAQDAVESVFCVLLRSIGSHVRPAFSRVIGELQALEHAVPAAAVAGDREAVGVEGLRETFLRAELRFFEVIHLSDLVVQMVEIYHSHALGAFVDERDFLNPCNQERKALEHAVDDSVAVGMDCVIEIILRQTQRILDVEQHTADYHPSAHVSLTLTPTLACARVVQFLGESTVALRAMTVQRQMRDVFLGEIGQRLFHVLLDHIRRFQITEPGGFQLIADLNLYYDWALEHVDPETLRFFAALKDLANCFILAPRDLRAFLRDQYSRHTFDGVMRSEEVYDIVACRADYRNIRTQVEGHCDFM